MTLHHIRIRRRSCSACAPRSQSGVSGIADLDAEDGSFHGAGVDDVHLGFDRESSAPWRGRAGSPRSIFPRARDDRRRSDMRRFRSSDGRAHRVSGTAPCARRAAGAVARTLLFVPGTRPSASPRRWRRRARGDHRPRRRVGAADRRGARRGGVRVAVAGAVLVRINAAGTPWFDDDLRCAGTGVGGMYAEGRGLRGSSALRAASGRTWRSIP